MGRPNFSLQELGLAQWTLAFMGSGEPFLDTGTVEFMFTRFTKHVR
jgi:hypothetical protein